MCIQDTCDSEQTLDILRQRQTHVHAPIDPALTGRQHPGATCSSSLSLASTLFLTFQVALAQQLIEETWEGGVLALLVNAGTQVQQAPS
jgi:hypothetical protein